MTSSEIGGSGRRYHHGDLRRVMVDAAVEAISRQGIDGWSLRELARKAGVSHAAPAHHFGDRAGLLTAVAEEGFDLLATALEASGDDFLEMGLAYVAFATAHPAHFLVMFQRSSYHADDEALRRAEERAGAALRAGAGRAPSASEATPLAGWSIAHGFASLWLGGAMGARETADPVAAARPVLALLLGQQARTCPAADAGGPAGAGVHSDEGTVT